MMNTTIKLTIALSSLILYSLYTIIGIANPLFRTVPQFCGVNVSCIVIRNAQVDGNENKIIFQRPALYGIIYSDNFGSRYARMEENDADRRFIRQ